MKEGVSACVSERSECVKEGVSEGMSEWRNE